MFIIIIVRTKLICFHVGVGGGGGLYKTRGVYKRGVS